MMCRKKRLSLYIITTLPCTLSTYREKSSNNNVSVTIIYIRTTLSLGGQSRKSMIGDSGPNPIVETYYNNFMSMSEISQPPSKIVV